MSSENTKYTFKNIHVFAISKISKWTWAAHGEDGQKLVTAKSKKMLISKLNDITTHATPTNETIPETKKSTSKPKKSKGVSKGSIKNMTIGLIIDGTDDAEIVSIIRETFPDSKFNNNHISWYRSTLYRDKIIGPEFAPRRSKAYKEWLSNQNILTPTTK